MAAPSSAAARLAAYSPAGKLCLVTGGTKGEWFWCRWARRTGQARREAGHRQVPAGGRLAGGEHCSLFAPRPLLVRTSSHTPSGIGRAVVEELAGLGARVFTCARSADALQELLAACSAQGWVDDTGGPGVGGASFC